MNGGLVGHLARFAGALRERGVRTSLADEADAAEAMALVDVADREELRRTLRIALKIRPRDAEEFDGLFEEWWGSVDPSARDFAADERRAPDRGIPPRRLGPTRRSASAGETRESESPRGDQPGYSAEALLRAKPFEACSESDLAAMERLLPRLVARLATRRSRRFAPARGRGRVDPRRSFRGAISTDGELLRLARRSRVVERAKIVALCDTSGSMDPHTRFLLAFLLALKTVAPRTEIFAFNTALTRLTPWVSAGKLRATLERLAAGVPDWSGGTRIGESLRDFVARYRDELVDGRTIVLIVSDGLDRGDTAELSAAMRALASRARRVIWLNPLLGDPRYEPIQRGMEAALPYVDVLAPAHDLGSLARVLPLFAA